MKRGIEITLVAGALLLGGCATHKYVNQRVEPVSEKINQVDKNQQNTQKQLEADEPKISAAQEKADSADNRAGDAMSHADAASKHADEVGSKVSTEIRSELNDRIANLDDYRSAGEATVLFKFNSDKLTDDGKQQLDQLASGQMGSLKRYFIAITGYTDKIGSPEYNMELSRRRAQTVQTYLVLQHNVPVYRIQIVGLGKEKPVNDEKTRADREKNRRVEVTIYSAGNGQAAQNQNPGSGQ